MEEKTEKEMLQSITSELFRTRAKLDRITNNVVFLFWFVALPFILFLIIGVMFMIFESNKPTYSQIYPTSEIKSTFETDMQKSLDDLDKNLNN